MTVPFRVVGQAGDPSDEFRNAQYYEASAEFFETMGIGLRRGRTFTDADGANAAGVAIINEALARQYFGDTDALGQIIEARINRGNPGSHGRPAARDRRRRCRYADAPARRAEADDLRSLSAASMTDYAGTGPFYVHARMDFAIRTERRRLGGRDEGRAPDRGGRGFVGGRRHSHSDARASLRLGGERSFLVTPARSLRRAGRVSRRPSASMASSLTPWSSALTNSASARRWVPDGATSSFSSCAKV